MEFGGFLEIDKYNNPMMHERAIGLNYARNCLAYLIVSKEIDKIALPKYLCSSVDNICKKYSLDIQYYSIGYDLLPKDLDLEENRWLYLVNYYGQIGNRVIKALKRKHDNLIVDNSHAYFQRPIKEIDTIYTCRKFFGVSDGAFLYTNKAVNFEIEQDKSFDRIRHLVGRFENSAEEFYTEFLASEKLIDGEHIKLMSKLTQNMLHAIDYSNVQKRRAQNYSMLYDIFLRMNCLKLKKNIPAYMYPLYVQNAQKIREELLRYKIYIPILWPEVLSTGDENEGSTILAKNILPLPVDQRYTRKEINQMAEIILSMINANID